MGALDKVTPQKAQEFLDAFHYAMRGMGTRMQLRKLRFLHRDAKWNECVATVHAFVDSYVDKALLFLASQSGIERSDEREKERYILLHEMAKQTEDTIELRHQVLHVFLAGHDSSSITVANAIFHLCRHPNAFQKLRAEVLEAKEGLTFERLKGLKYLQHVVKESRYLLQPQPKQSIKRVFSMF